LSRTLNYLNQQYPKNKWSKDFKKLLARFLKLKNKLDLQNREHQIERTSIVKHLTYWNGLLIKNIKSFTLFTKECAKKGIASLPFSTSKTCRQIITPRSGPYAM